MKTIKLNEKGVSFIREIAEEYLSNKNRTYNDLERAEGWLNNFGLYELASQVRDDLISNEYNF